ncbi:hypothetical protein SAMN03097708_00840 [Thiohalomonas denitrificans]|uniref:Uncharacterized protein n=1 Tax=Thiohalomonas denitrificans TaxID=415747 RepID=A0A1G5PTV5_9GAMM|nr:hypothetical protein SAMN03097708_00840 [Thiohalomonas denitrificans]
MLPVYVNRKMTGRLVRNRHITMVIRTCAERGVVHHIIGRSMLGLHRVEGVNIIGMYTGMFARMVGLRLMVSVLGIVQRQILSLGNIMVIVDIRSHIFRSMILIVK